MVCGVPNRGIMGWGIGNTAASLATCTAMDKYAEGLRARMHDTREGLTIATVEISKLDKSSGRTARRKELKKLPPLDSADRNLLDGR